MASPGVTQYLYYVRDKSRGGVAELNPLEGACWCMLLSSPFAVRFDTPQGAERWARLNMGSPVVVERYPVNYYHKTAYPKV